MWRRGVLVAVVAVALGLPSTAAHGGTVGVVTRTVSFTVDNPSQAGQRLRVAGTLYRPADRSTCTSVLLLVHGLSYGQYAWDFPIDPDRYSVARAVARAGYAAVSIDLPGYGKSTRPSGYGMTVFAYANIVNQILGQLKAGSYGGPAFAHTGLLSHSAGSEVSELAASMAPVDVLMATAYTHLPSPNIVRDFFTGDYARAATSDYEYFCETPEHRTQCMYYAPGADPKVMKRDNQLANRTASGEVYSIGPQLSKLVMGAISAPVLLVLGEHDYIFPPTSPQAELLLFSGTTDKQFYVAPGVGHAFMLHRSAPRTNAVITRWLAQHAAAVPACAA